MPERRRLLTVAPYPALRSAMAEEAHRLGVSANELWMLAAEAWLETRAPESACRGCSAEHRESGRLCTRIDGHEGPHIALWGLGAKLRIVTWNDEPGPTEAILRALPSRSAAPGGLTARAVADATGLAPRLVGTLLNRLERDGRAVGERSLAGDAVTWWRT